ncbi:ABC transporter substrate-binding protein [Geobacter sp. AOG1]|uniref:ABC transporter substrate-binding protein n=1 Tax=Geobacter sp. AOG1 TaxID=1566346 RepID=UPI0035A62780
MCRNTVGFLLVLCGVFAMAAGQASAAGNTIKVGIIAEMTGTFADHGKEMMNGIKTYMMQHGDSVAGKKIELIVKDTGGPNPDVAKRLAQELIVKDKVDILAGFGLTPNALAVAPIATEAKKPVIILNAATSIITTKSPYIARVSFTLAQVTAPMAEWAYKHGIRKVYTVVGDYGPGHDSEAAFKKAFTKLGGQVVGDLRVPMKNVEFGPYMQRVKDAKPEAVFVFVTSGELGIGIMKAYNERGMKQAGIKLITTGDVFDDAVMDALGDTPLGVISTHHYSADHKSPENAKFVADYKKVDSKLRPNFKAVHAYDGMAAIYAVAKQLKGDVSNGDKVMQALKGLKLNSPRGPIQIDPETRDIVQNVYVREAKKVGGKVYNVEFDTFNAVKDPGK